MRGLIVAATLVALGAFAGTADAQYYAQPYANPAPQIPTLNGAQSNYQGSQSQHQNNNPMGYPQPQQYQQRGMDPRLYQQPQGGTMMNMNSGRICQQRGNIIVCN